MANNSRNSLNTYAAVGAVGAAAAGAMLYKRTHTTCGQCGCKITGRQYTIRAYNEESKAAIEMAGANPHLIVTMMENGRHQERSAILDKLFIWSQAGFFSQLR